MALSAFFNTVFSPLLELPGAVAVIIISFIISLLIILITKLTTNQQVMKSLKDEMKEHQKKMKESRSDPSKTLEIHKKAMEANMKYMGHSLKPTLITMIPIFLIFGWMSDTFAFESINPGQEFMITASFAKGAAGSAFLAASKNMQVIGNNTQEIQDRVAKWTLKGEEGDYDVEVKYGDISEVKKVIITKSNAYAPSIEKKGSQIESVQINYNKKILIPIGFRDWLGWLGTYILSSLAFTMILRKFLKVY